MGFEPSVLTLSTSMGTVVGGSPTPTTQSAARVRRRKPSSMKLGADSCKEEYRGQLRHGLLIAES
jgi:hypothetical protein